MDKNTGENFFINRVKKLRERLRKQDVDCMTVFKDENIYYLTGFYAKDSGSIIILQKREIYLLVHFIYREQAKKTVMLKKIKIVEYVKKRDEKYKEIISSERGKIAGIEGSSISYDDYMSNKKILSGLGWKIKNLSSFIEEARKVKDQYEITSVKKACKISDDSVKDILKMDFSTISGFSEKKLALHIEAGMLDRNSDGRSFDLIVASNTASSLPHYISSGKIIKSGCLLLDIGCIFNKYCSDITRTVFTGNSLSGSLKAKNIDKLKKIYDIVLQAQLRSLESCREGISCTELDKVARDYISGMGYGEYFGHGLGHGVGLEVHESPKVTPSKDMLLEENMIITIEPGIYLEGIGGVRIEDMVIVKKNGCENLYSSPKELTVIG